MLIRSLILIISIFYTQLIHAVPKVLDLQLGKATLSDVKKKYKIIEEHAYGDGIKYVLDIASIPKVFGELADASIWCDEINNIVQGAILIMYNVEFNDIKSSFSNKYKFVGRRKNVSKNNAKFEDNDYEIFIYSTEENSSVVEIIYMNKIFKSALYENQDIINIDKDLF